MQWRGFVASECQSSVVQGDPAGGVAALAAVTAVLVFLCLRRRRRLRGVRLLQDAKACRRSSGSESDHGKRQLVAASGGHSTLVGVTCDACFN